MIAGVAVFGILSLQPVHAEAASDAPVHIEGARYVTKSGGGVRFGRFSEDLLAKTRSELNINSDNARNPAGVVLAFETDSPSGQLHFNVLKSNWMGAGFGVYRDGVLIDEPHFPQHVEEIDVPFDSGGIKHSVLYEIVLPSFTDIEWTSLTVVPGSKIEAAYMQKPGYVALGDSISHGTGQGGASHVTWPFLLSRKLHAELFNLAVGGGKISVPIAKMLKDWEHIDLITILIGFNDLHWGNKTPEQYTSDYNELLDAIRANHPETKIVCITPLYARKTFNETTGYTVDEFRDALAGLVEERRASDSNLVLVRGEEITSEENLNEERPQDPVHLGNHGARLFADALYPLIAP